jgi:hypothetical protein
MKKITLIVALSLGVSASYAQTVKEAEVPAAVKEAFKKQHPTAKAEKWEKEDGNYEVEYDLNKSEASDVYDASGKLLQTEVEIKTSELPKAVSDYVTKNLAGKKISEAAKITESNGTVTYEAEVGKADYIFDANGNFVKKEEDHPGEKDDDVKKKKG